MQMQNVCAIYIFLISRCILIPANNCTYVSVRAAKFNRNLIAASYFRPLNGTVEHAHAIRSVLLTFKHVKLPRATWCDRKYDVTQRRKNFN